MAQMIKYYWLLKEALDNAKDGRPPDAVFMCSRSTCRANPPDGTWKGCPVPDCCVWHCLGSVACANELTAHISKHLAHVVANK